MGYALAEECASRGANVTLVSGPVALSAKSSNINVVSVESAREMLDECQKVFPTSDISIMCAAVADYAPANPSDHKIKREKQDVPTITLVKNPDIAATLGKEKRPEQVLVGFALETDNEAVNASEKLTRKNLDMIVLNSLRDKGACFGTDTNKVSIIRSDKSRTDFPLKDKSEVAGDIIDEILKILGKV